MSLDDGLVMQIHPGSYRNHNPLVFDRFGRDKVRTFRNARNT